jgi:hypothetical protein
MLLVGSLVYLLFRPPLSWFPKIASWDSAVIELSCLPSFISSFVKFHLSDVVWALALGETVYFIKKNLLLGVVIALASTIIFESMQFLGIIPGTGDIWDIIFVTIALSIYYIIKKRGIFNEKQQI